ncbi:MAG: 50S ribosomal protein L23 [Patescibacteria group bacterium]
MNTQLLIKPIITEKSLALANTQNCYTFGVQVTASKNQIAEIVTSLYKVEVAKVRTASLQSRARRTGKRRVSSMSPKTKKALVYLKEGHSIDLFNVGGAEQ